MPIRKFHNFGNPAGDVKYVTSRVFAGVSFAGDMIDIYLAV